jgi:hypothetical protein
MYTKPGKEALYQAALTIALAASPADILLNRINLRDLAHQIPDIPENLTRADIRQATAKALRRARKIHMDTNTPDRTADHDPNANAADLGQAITFLLNTAELAAGCLYLHHEDALARALGKGARNVARWFYALGVSAGALADDES